MEKNKKEELRKAKALNPNPNKVRDPLFLENEFFDAHDIIQVKYEMLRQQQTDNRTVQEVAGSFGLSKVTYYEARRAFEESGIYGLQPKKRGPKQRYKLTPELLEYAILKKKQDPTLRLEDLLALIREKFGTSIHRRTLERGLSGKKKGGRIRRT